MLTLTKPQIAFIGRQVYGTEWQSPMAIALGLTLRRFRYALEKDKFTTIQKDTIKVMAGRRGADLLGLFRFIYKEEDVWNDPQSGLAAARRAMAATVLPQPPYGWPLDMIRVDADDRKK